MNYTYIRVKKKFFCSPDNIVPRPRTYGLYKCKRGEIYKTNMNTSYLNDTLVKVLSIVDVLKLLKKDKNALKKIPEML
jgi:hypothetical protein